MSENLPKLYDLYNDENKIIKRQNDLNVLLNQPPKESWLKEHPFAKGVKYLPIGRVEYLLKAIYIKTRTEVVDYKLIGNSATVHVRLHYKDPVTGEWDFEDGLGATPLQTDKEAGAIEFDRLKTDSVMKGLPAAESFAIKDAAEKLGKIFGKDINRKEEIVYNSLLKNFLEISEEEFADMNKTKIIIDEYTDSAELIANKDKILEDFEGDAKTEIKKEIQKKYDRLNNETNL